jgi:RimJ/RimL family protein N-acetyltransferase
MIWWPTEIPTLRHGTLTLRPSREEDIQQIFLACQDPVIPRFTTVPSPYTLAHAEGFIRDLAPKQFLDQKEILFVITSNQNLEDEFCGVISFHTSNIANHTTELGYWIARQARGKGIGKTAVNLISDFGLNTIGFRRIEAYVDTDNVASRALLASAEYTFEGTLVNKVTRTNGEQIDMALFAKVSD